jgi:uncharacterized protein (TIGR03663 family)
VLILAATVFGALLRLTFLEQRPMHGDEAVHAVKFGELLEEGYYQYDPYEYHGPTLNYLTLIPAWLTGKANFNDVSEFTLRIIPVFFGVLLILLLLLAVDGIGEAGAAVAACLIAVSPAFVFYSRYYIQEMLLVSFSFGIIVCGYRYLQSRKIIWVLLDGMFVGLCHATKETCIIVFGSIVLALLLTWFKLSPKGDRRLILEKVRPWHITSGIAVGVVVSILFFSSFFSNSRGIVDSVCTYTTYVNRAGQNPLHIHPWYYYLKMIIWSKYGGGPLWSEAIILVLACAGFIAAMRNKGVRGVNSGLLVFLAFYTLAMTVAYSLIPYKTPWCMLGFLHGMILLAGVGVVVIVRAVPNVFPRLIVLCLLIECFVHLGWQCYTANYKFHSDPRSPYVYAHPTEDVLEISERVKKIAASSRYGAKMPVQIVCEGNDYWPLPWYLRSMNVYWWNEFDSSVQPAPVIITSSGMEGDMAKFIDRPPPVDLYVGLFERDIQLRPQVELRCYVTKDLKDRYEQDKTVSGSAKER